MSLFRIFLPFLDLDEEVNHVSRAFNLFHSVFKIKLFINSPREVYVGYVSRYTLKTCQRSNYNFTRLSLIPKEVNIINIGSWRKEGKITISMRPRNATNPYR